MRQRNIVGITAALCVAGALWTPSSVVGASFVRGDVDANGRQEITDFIRLLGHLFLGGPVTLDCPDAADANDDGTLDLSDASLGLSFLFLGGAPLPAPFPICGADPTEDALDCVVHPSCELPVTAFELRRSESERDLAPDVSGVELNELVSGNTSLAVDLYRSAQETEGNIFFSPYSITTALAMAYAGARENTATEMANALHFTLDDNKLHAALNALDLQLASRAEDIDEEGDAFELTVANSMWGQRNFDFLDTYLDRIAMNYGAGLRLVDFVAETEASRVTINDWVEEMTRERIQDLIPAGVLTVDTRLVLTNAIFFKASWKTPFPEGQTRDGTFYLPNGTETTVPMMSNDATYGQYQGDGFQAVELPYLGEQLSMVVIVPDDGALETVETALSPELLAGVFAGLQPARLLLRFPKFGFEFNLPLKERLLGLGMVDAFDGSRADFSGIDGRPQFLFVQDVLHKGFIAVDEKGTEAAAATAVVIGIESLPPSLTVDRPFLFLIRDIPTGSVLFLGRVVDPSA